MKTGRRAIPLNAPELKAWCSDLVEKAIDALVGHQWRAEDSGEEDAGRRPVGTVSGLSRDVLKLRDVKGREWAIPVNVSTRPGNTSGPTAGGNFIFNPMWEKDDAPAKVINIWLNGKWSTEELQREKWEVVKQVQSILLHEVTHALDNIDKVESLSGDKGDAYYNQAHEVRAYARQVVDDVLKAYKVMLLQQRRLPPGHTLPTGQRLIEQLLDSSPVWVAVGHHFNPTNQKLIRQMVVRELQDAHPDRRLAARVLSRWRATRSGYASR